VIDLWIGPREVTAKVSGSEIYSVRITIEALPEHVPKKLLEFFDQDMLQLFDPERFLVDHVIPRDRETL
jgi:uncharacterized Zn finger protein